MRVPACGLRFARGEYMWFDELALDDLSDLVMVERMRVDAAWRARDYAGVVDALELIEAMTELTPSERGRLELARKLNGGTG